MKEKVRLQDYLTTVYSCIAEVDVEYLLVRGDFLSDKNQYV